MIPLKKKKKLGRGVNQCHKTGDKILMNNNYLTFSYREEISVFCSYLKKFFLLNTISFFFFFFGNEQSIQKLYYTLVLLR